MTKVDILQYIGEIVYQSL